MRKSYKNERICQVCGLEELISQCPYYPKAIYNFSVIPIKIPTFFSVMKNDAKINMEIKRPQIAKAN